MTLPNDDQEFARVFLSKLRVFGVFLVPVGELERWLDGTGIKGHGNDWVVNFFEILADDEARIMSHLNNTGELWEFLDAVACWISNPSRRGMNDQTVL